MFKVHVPSEENVEKQHQSSINPHPMQHIETQCEFSFPNLCSGVEEDSPVNPRHHPRFFRGCLVSMMRMGGGTFFSDQDPPPELLSSDGSASGESPNSYWKNSPRAFSLPFQEGAQEVPLPEQELGVFLWVRQV